MLLSPAGGECCKSRRRGMNEMNRGRSKMTEEQADVLVSRRACFAQRRELKMFSLLERLSIATDLTNTGITATPVKHF